MPWPDGVGRLIQEEADSTNSVLMDLARREKATAWLLARRQTAGRGRRGKAWVSGAGNFFASHLMWPEGDPSLLALHSFAAALALAEALQETCGVAPVFKWPNDLLVEGRKVSGILLETAVAHGSTGLITGIGVNLLSAPGADAVEPGKPRPAALGDFCERVPTAEALLDAVAPAYAAWSARLARDGFAPVRAAWLARASGLGQPIEARLPHATHTGTFEDVDARGALVLRAADGRLVLPAADVYFTKNQRG